MVAVASPGLVASSPLVPCWVSRPTCFCLRAAASLFAREMGWGLSRELLANLGFFCLGLLWWAALLPLLSLFRPDWIIRVALVEQVTPNKSSGLAFLSEGDGSQLWQLLFLAHHNLSFLVLWGTQSPQILSGGRMHRCRISRCWQDVRMSWGMRGASRALWAAQ